MKQTAVETLNDLILINNDRLKGYEWALEDLDTPDADLKNIFEELVAQTKRFNAILNEEVYQSGEKPETDSAASGRLHRAWFNLKARLFSSKSRKKVLIECEKMEDTSKEAYDEAIHNDNYLSESQRELIAEQAREQKESHDRIKTLRDDALKE